MRLLSNRRHASLGQSTRSQLLLALVCCAAPAFAQKPVYRCETAGRVSYSDAPCVGAKEIDATPTQGMDKMTGKSRKGQDVQRAERNAAFAEAFQPLTGMNADEYRVYQRRFKLSPADKLECARLDNRLPGLKQAAQTAAANDLAQAEVDLYKARKRFHDLNC